MAKKKTPIAKPLSEADKFYIQANYNKSIQELVDATGASPEEVEAAASVFRKLLDQKPKEQKEPTAEDQEIGNFNPIHHIMAVGNGAVSMTQAASEFSDEVKKALYGKSTTPKYIQPCKKS